MKKFFLLILPAIVLFACGNQTQNGNSSSKGSITETSNQNETKIDPTPNIENAVKNLYDDVSKVNSDGFNTYNDFDIIKMHGSSDLKGVLEAYNKTQVDGEIGAIDWDIFTQAQDFDKFSFEVQSVSLKDNNTAEAQVAMTNCGEKYNVTILMVNENGIWLVDDVIGHQTGSTKKLMKENSADANVAHE